MNGQLIDSLKNNLTSKDKLVVQEAYFDLAWEYSFYDLDSAEFFCNKALDLSYSSEDSLSIFKMKSMMASIYDLQSRIEESVALYVDVATYYSKEQNLAQLSKTYNNLGVLFFNQQNYNQAYFYFEKSMQLDLQLGDSLGIVGSIVNLASILNQQEKFQEGMRLFQKGKKIAESIGGESWIFDGVYEGIGNNYIYQEKYDSALIYLQSLIEKHRRNKDAQSALTVLNSIARVNAELGNYEEAIDNILEAENWAEKLKNNPHERSLFDNAAFIYSKMGNFEKAFAYQEKYIASNDSLTRRERIEIINGLERKYQSEQKEKEIAILSVSNQKSINERNLLLFVATVLVLAGIFLFSLWNSKSKSAKLIEKSLSEKETLLKEIHHRVKNNLQIVSSLLSLQSRFIKDQGALDAVNEGQTRVESMALIHQKLYQDNNLSGVYALDYIQDLTDVLCQSYGAYDRVEVHYDVDDLSIDVDTIIPIGLILNELISNSFKHAFPNEKEGNLFITLKEENDTLILQVADDGTVKAVSNKESNSFGIILIESLAQKLKASVETDFSNGAKTSLIVTKYKLV